MNDRITFQKADYARDVSLVYRWMQEEHVIPFWHLNMPFAKFEDHFHKAITDPHQTLYIGSIDGVPMSYWESYWVKGDVIEHHFDNEPFDQGIHLLIGEKEYLGKGLALPLLKAMVCMQFAEPNTKKVIAEPDIRNKKMIHVFEKCGFRRIKPVNLPDKTGLLMFCERERFFEKGKKDELYKESH
ncbi:GNAT family N-acetyltransferase [Bacillus paralicheniformis]|uniref:GNAT family N-acetyltransferase n=1 Tax=Bacillus paralicheniformis TaxID=1648923 RepID=UPI000D041B07|nr:GNAT family N-acetyltransferase [Bacillus paralicheniformis]MBZ5213093.1 acetyltransferase [Bacillus paralicheniformis]MDW6054580.1 GNAT family N-acetyltransferase [Bacillus paralicheniformis]